MLIDWKRVEALRAEIGEDAFEEVVTLFIEEVEEVIARLRAEAWPMDLGADLHFLKGSALNLGFAALSVACQAGESMAAAGQAGAVDRAAIVGLYETSRRSFESGAVPTAAHSA